MNVVYETATGRLVSIGTVVANPLPAGLSVQTLGTADRDGLRSGRLVWDAPSRSLVVAAVQPVEVNRQTLESRVRDAVAANLTSISQIPNGVNAMNNILADNATNLDVAIDTVALTVKRSLESQERILKQLVALERLLVGSDLLDSVEGTA